MLREKNEMRKGEAEGDEETQVEREEGGEGSRQEVVGKGWSGRWGGVLYLLTRGGAGIVIQEAWVYLPPTPTTST